jgi:hypothetical protein
MENGTHRTEIDTEILGNILVAVPVFDHVEDTSSALVGSVPQDLGALELGFVGDHRFLFSLQGRPMRQPTHRM